MLWTRWRVERGPGKEDSMGKGPETGHGWVYLRQWNRSKGLERSPAKAQSGTGGSGACKVLRDSGRLLSLFGAPEAAPETKVLVGGDPRKRRCSTEKGRHQMKGICKANYHCGQLQLHPAARKLVDSAEHAPQKHHIQGAKALVIVLTNSH